MASTETAPHDVETALQFAKNDKRRMLHVVYRVGDLDKTIESGFLPLFFHCSCVPFDA